MPLEPKLADLPRIRGALRFYQVASVITGLLLLLLCTEMIMKYGFGLELELGGPQGFLAFVPIDTVTAVNLSTGEHFHLTDLTRGLCTGPDATTPTAPFDTYYGTGTGRLNGAPANIWFNFVDRAEPGAGVDIAAFTIQTAAGNLLQCANTLEGGNNQAHQATGNTP